MNNHATRYQYRYSLRTKLLSCILLASLPPVITTLVITYNLYQSRAKLVLATNSVEASAAGKALQHYLATIWSASKATGSAIDTSPSVKANGILHTQLKRIGGLESLSWLDGNGNVRYTTLPATAPSLATTMFVLKIINGAEQSVSDVYTSALTQQPSISLAQAVKQGNRLRGIMVSTVNLTQVGHVLNLPVSHNRIGFLDRQGAIIYDSTAPTMPMQQRLQSRLPASDALLGKTVITKRFQPETSSQSHMGVATPISELGFVAYSYTPVNMAMSTAQRYVVNGFLTIIAALLASIGASWVVGTQVTKRARALKKAAVALASGNFTHRVLLKGNDELAVAAAALDSMATRLQLDETELYTRAERLRMALDVGQMVVWAFDTSTNLITWSGTDNAIPGVPAEGQFTYANYLQAVYPDDRDAVARTLNLALAQGTDYNYEHRISLAGENVHWLSIKGRLSYDNKGRLKAVGVAMDVTNRKQAEEKLRYLSFHDGPTGLYNRTFFEMELERLDNANQWPIGLIMVDVNGLKLINDGFGHIAGDQQLAKVAQVLLSCARPQDIAARWGGDEFVVLLPKTNESTVAHICDSILQNAATMVADPVPISIALGYAVKNRTHEDLHSVLAEAEARMYRRKLLESRSAHSSIISSLARTLRERSHETEEHARRLQQLSLQLGHCIGLPSSVLDELSLAAALHDIGKVGINDTILMKAGPLTDEEWQQMRKHVEIGYRIALSSPEIAPVARAILFHHEWWNGSGYPEGLQGKAIPLISRILSIVDAYDVMTHNRPYKPALSEEAALAELKRCSSTQFDPFLVEQFAAMIVEPNISFAAEIEST